MIMMLNIKLIKMINGEEIIAKVKDEDATHITVTKPAIVMMAPGQNGNMSVQMGPYCPYTDDDLPIGRHVIVYMTNPNNELLNGYNNAFGSGLLVPPSPSQLLKG
jgi:hypothetical protein